MSEAEGNRFPTNLVSLRLLAGAMHELRKIWWCDVAYHFASALLCTTDLTPRKRVADADQQSSKGNEVTVPALCDPHPRYATDLCFILAYTIPGACH
ncbi:hypothetical protein [Thermosporothrix hazakensis]|uniref:hypothetical protein n=1 Tax=Thermosporothrix hazakensis TaxID=644383 RepID=UPI001B871E4A|nr:hypothetical protein [Thermosporothrix hazakensis]